MWNVPLAVTLLGLFCTALVTVEETAQLQFTIAALLSTWFAQDAALMAVMTWFLP
jgi:hypothetical protein